MFEPIFFFAFFVCSMAILLYYRNKKPNHVPLVGIIMIFILLLSLLQYYINNNKSIHTFKKITQETSTQKIVFNESAVFLEEQDPPQISSVLIDAPIMSQLPELPRGCEVTSLAMLLNDAGVSVDKMTLAKEVKKDSTPYQRRNGKIFFGHPNEGFVGDMYTRENPGLGVYHKPIKELAEKYLPNQIVDLTGQSFEEIYPYLLNGSPVWVITNTTYRELPPNEFVEWQTPKGPIKITYREHSVLITGFDEQFIYFNDPLTGTKNKKAPKQEFIEAWEQMGMQAITIKMK
ncbi:MAG: C39 family peptidase [Bacillus sp. (in: Bacteria)]|nr:C39 family peptidase [Bacillus sp. (in: firmicutes)]